VFRMSYLDNLSEKQIAERLGISLSTVENHMYSALKQLRLKLTGV
jgi:RNA polymerase sigma-70 factor (ECF subfamily)